MKMKIVKCSLVFCCFCFLLLVSEGITNFDDESRNLIGKDDRRGVTEDELKGVKYEESVEESRKRGQYVNPSSTGFNRPYYSSSGYDDYDSSRGPSFSSSGSGNYYGGNTLTGETYPHYPSPGYGSGYGSAPSGPEEYPFSSSGGNQHQVGTFGVSNKILALKGLLAGIALLGAAAALSTNPVLLQLGVVKGRRRRRSIIRQNVDVYPTNPFAESRQGKSGNR